MNHKYTEVTEYMKAVESRSTSYWKSVKYGCLASLLAIGTISSTGYLAFATFGSCILVSIGYNNSGMANYSLLKRVKYFSPVILFAAGTITVFSTGSITTVLAINNASKHYNLYNSHNEDILKIVNDA